MARFRARAVDARPGGGVRAFHCTNFDALRARMRSVMYACKVQPSVSLKGQRHDLVCVICVCRAHVVEQCLIFSMRMSARLGPERLHNSQHV